MKKHSVVVSDDAVVDNLAVGAMETDWRAGHGRPE
jgi:hypothetical protein